MASQMLPDYLCSFELNVYNIMILQGKRNQMIRCPLASSFLSKSTMQTRI
ncbi:uncharacterized protein PHALS_11013 [Plasmopara halstedii]|uniref:Uncharacterized protein n=1 Tax=Plasmopara halstedii TaxID=4781 RepID=A0A0P1AI77_PLAHL|nr:uncharacterized protein PHALS_11013 [Plasmopara halstedii]CEG40834.1 hypothetical protein PHALS_11013 [Plasmopara halstedii]|eukprot:XP_024577203.1 hypothetical protein PHALS_11013 [Plasmopara halstedii]